MSREPEAFWMVKGPGPASMRHDTRGSAEREAERLARANPGQSFYVLQAVALIRKIDVERIELCANEGLP
ncbi:hypothetical protein CNY89_00115, partial [Amaricoccus sp. HAR-UPW-R2A-40]